MSHYIGDVEIPAITEISVDESTNKSERDIVGENSNIVWNSESAPPEIDVSFVLTPEAHSLDYSLDKQIEEVKRIVSKDATENSFAFKKISGYLYIDDLSLPDPGDSDVLIEGSLSAILLDWPKHFEEKSGPLPYDSGFGRFFGREFGGDASELPYGYGEYGSGDYSSRV